MKKKNVILGILTGLCLLAILSWYSSRADYLMLGEAAMTFGQTFLYFSTFSFVILLVVGIFAYFLVKADNENKKIIS